MRFFNICCLFVRIHISSVAGSHTNLVKSDYYKNSIELPEYVWLLEECGKVPSVKWKII